MWVFRSAYFCHLGSEETVYGTAWDKVRTDAEKGPPVNLLHLFLNAATMKRMERGL